MLLNKKTHGQPQGSVYIGRMSGDRQYFGNPFTHKVGTKASVVVSSREEAVRAFREWLLGNEYEWVEREQRRWIITHLHLLRKKDLVCWCAPEPCHGEVLLKYAHGSVIRHFAGDFLFLDNKYLHGFEITAKGQEFRFLSVESAMQALQFEDLDIWRKIEKMHGHDAAAFGWESRHLVRKDWDTVKLRAMDWCLRKKFADPSLRKKLAGTREYLIVYHGHDSFWGENWGPGPNNQPGRNELGFLLMDIRRECYEVGNEA